jgi:transporter family protein
MNTFLGIMFAIFAMLGYGINNSIVKIPLSKVSSEKYNFNFAFYSLFVYLIFVIIFIDTIKISLFYFFISFILGIIGFLSIWFFLKAMKIGKVGVVSPVANSSALFTIVFSVIFFSEILKFNQIIAIVLLLLGIVLISLNFKDLKKSEIFSFASGIPYAFGACFFWGVLFFLFKFPVNVIGPYLTSFFMQISILILAYFNLRIKEKGNEIIIKDKKVILYGLICTILASLATVFYNIGITYYHVSVVSAITFSSPLISVLSSKFFYKEKLKIQQYLAVIMIIIGIIVISF